MKNKDEALAALQAVAEQYGERTPGIMIDELDVILREADADPESEECLEIKAQVLAHALALSAVSPWREYKSARGLIIQVISMLTKLVGRHVRLVEENEDHTLTIFGSFASPLELLRDLEEVCDSVDVQDMADLFPRHPNEEIH